jgi:hypothetical protein
VQRDNDSFDCSKSICRLQSMKRIFEVEKRWSTANCNERDEKNGNFYDEKFQKALQMLYIRRSRDEHQR